MFHEYPRVRHRKHVWLNVGTQHTPCGTFTSRSPLIRLVLPPSRAPTMRGASTRRDSVSARSRRQTARVFMLLAGVAAAAGVAGYLLGNGKIPWRRHSTASSVITLSTDARTCTGRCHVTTPNHKNFCELAGLSCINMISVIPAGSIFQRQARSLYAFLVWWQPR